MNGKTCYYRMGQSFPWKKRYTRLRGYNNMKTEEAIKIVGE
jgi:hypothetical protein